MIEPAAMIKRSLLVGLGTCIALVGLSLSAIAQTALAEQPGASARIDAAPSLKRPSPIAPLSGASRWEVVKGGRIRLMVAAPLPTGSAEAAIEIELQPGFKTYWRNPGPDGIPPQIGFLGSSNVAGVSMALPPPRVFREANVTVGYKDKVRFPVTVKVKNSDAPYQLTASGVVGFCADICVPVPFRLQAASPLRPGAQSAAFSAPADMLAPSTGLSLEEARLDKAAMQLSVDARVPDTDVLLELVVDQVVGAELPPAAAKVHQKGDRATFTFDLREGTELPEGKELTFTLIVGRLGQSGRIGVEQTLPLDVLD